MDYLKIKGARQHNLKNLSLEIPKNKLVVITGVSGSGKSSLAFDTIYAEGQRRYVESLTAYARQFLGIMDKPDVDFIEGLSPSISIDQKSSSHNPRSTVGTITEIFDFLRLLFARIGHPHCPKCKVEISRMSLDEISRKISELIINLSKGNSKKPHTFSILGPIVKNRKGEFKELLNNIASKGYNTIRLDSKQYNLQTDEINLLKTNKHSIDVEIDRFSFSSSQLKDTVFLANFNSRLTHSIEQALQLSGGLVLLAFEKEKEHLFSEKLACPICNYSLLELEPRMFSFNSPLCACETCKGLGTVYKVDPKLVLNERLTIKEGGILPYSKLYFQDSWHVRIFKQMCFEEQINLDVPISQLPKEKQNLLLYGSPKQYKVTGSNRFGKITGIVDMYKGVINEIENRFYDSQTQHEDIEVNKFVREEICSECRGKRLKPEILAVTIQNDNIIDLADKSIYDLAGYFSIFTTKVNSYENEVAKLIIKEINVRLSFLNNVGLSYLTISRTAKTLSGGELQRIRLASQLGTGLTGVLYVLDEPSIGLHPKDVDALIHTLKNLRDLGNSVMIVEHDRETIENADYTIELGPKAGKAGGHLIFSGTLVKMKTDKKSLTGAYLTGRKQIDIQKRDMQINRGWIDLQGASQFNLKKIDIKIPIGNLIAVTGVSGSGKSTLVTETLYPALKYYLDGNYHGTIGEFSRLLGYQYINRVYLVDQGPIGRTPRSNPATYVGIFDNIRELYSQTSDAKSQGYKKGRFSFNIKGGRCEKCQGTGLIRIQMQFLPDVYITCDVCEGHRYNKETLEIRFKDKNIYDVLSMTIDDAYYFFQNHYIIANKLSFLKSVGLGYIQLGQPAPTFSGGEAQRIKLANELSRKDNGRTFYILDEPTTGLHMYDIDKLLHTLYELVDRGSTVVIIEHNIDVIKNCQYIIDLGPEGGDKGGNVLYQGSLNGIMKVPSSFTAQYVSKI